MDNEEVVMDGWNAISDAFQKAYPGQDDPKHYGVLIPWRLGGNDPLDGFSIYDSGDCWHFVTYGLTELHEKESDDPEYSGFGMEFTLRLKKGCYEDEEAELRCICGIFQSIARLTFEHGELFNVWEYIYTGQQTGVDARQISKITGFFTIPDTKVPPMQTPNGKVEFVEFVGATDAELLKLKNKEMTVKELYEQLGTDVTDYGRESLY